MGAAGTGFSDARHQAVELLSNALPKAEHLFDSSRVLGVVFRVETYAKNSKSEINEATSELAREAYHDSRSE